MQLTYRFRLRDKHASELNRQARAVNFVWNYCNATQQKAARARRQWLSAFTLCRLTAGAGKDLDLHAHTVQGVCKQYIRSRELHRRPWLRFRGRKSLGWVPFNTGHVTVVGQTLKFRGVIYEPMHWRDIPEGAKIGAGSFSQDAKGHWYINLPVQDHLHKVSAAIARTHDVIVVGDVSASKMARTKMAKSALDAGWSDLKNMLRYKAMRHNGTMVEVDERMSTQTCSECGALPPERPRGIAGLGIREWTCGGCGAEHDRDVNAARNILRVGLDTLAEGASQ